MDKQLIAAILGIGLIVAYFGIQGGWWQPGGFDLSQWTYVPCGASAQPVIENGMLRMSSYGTTCRPLMIFNENVGSDYEVTCRVYVIDSMYGGSPAPEAQIVVRYGDENNYYFCGLGAYGYTSAVGKFVNDVASIVGTGSGSPNYGDISHMTWYNIRVRVVGNTIATWVNNVECSVTDSSHATGQVGLVVYASDAYFSNFNVVTIP